MKIRFQLIAELSALILVTVTAVSADDTPKLLFMDVHDLESVTAEAVAEAHSKDLAVQDKYGVDFLRYWVDETHSKVYCLAAANDAKSISAAHSEAHGLVPQNVHQVSAGEEAAGDRTSRLFLDVHRVGAGKVSVEDVAAAHDKDLAVQDAHNVHFINYWVDPRSGDIFCLSEARNAEDVLETHREAHGLISDEIAEVTEG
ncbi:MAG: DUF4242 domain-containing protein [Xanthomonadales bacterium]|nr:DUF4242 domain-containing protein [Xanthomonadales bacterium]